MFIKLFYCLETVIYLCLVCLDAVGSEINVGWVEPQVKLNAVLKWKELKL